MRVCRFTFSLFLLLCCIARLQGCASTSLQTISLNDLQSKPVRILAETEHDLVTCFLISTECPISNSYVPEMKSIVEAYRNRVQFYFVYVDSDLVAQDAASHAAAYGLNAQAILDSDHQFTRAVSADVVPQAVVLSKSGAVEYCGRIDDWYTDLGKRRAVPSDRTLRNVIDALLQGKRFAQRRTQAIGCYIEPRGRGGQ